VGISVNVASCFKNMSELSRIKQKMVSVVCSVYNGEKWLEECTSSVLNQSFIDFEFIIVNDGSSDSSWEIIQDLASKDPRIRAFNRNWSGLADSLNFGIEKSVGKWIARIDVDDICHPERLHEQLDFAERDERLVLVGSWCNVFDCSLKLGRDAQYPFLHEELRGRLLKLNRGFFPHSTAFFRRSAFFAVGGYRSKLTRAQDYDLWLRICEHGRIGCVQRDLVQIRKHAQQISHLDLGFRQIADCRMALVSWFIVQSGLDDPLDSAAPEALFQEFKDFIDNEVINYKISSQYNFIKTFRDLYQSNRYLELVYFLSTFSAAINFFKFCFRKVVGEGYSKKIAQLWREGRA
jgi:glycosyltransferase involved in cell wall biosynthesis